MFDSSCSVSSAGNWEEMTGGGVEGVWKVELAVRCLFESPILFCGVVSTNPRKSFVWHWIAGIVNS